VLGHLDKQPRELLLAQLRFEQLSLQRRWPKAEQQLLLEQQLNHKPKTIQPLG
jgi:hypothetical protein